MIYSGYQGIGKSTLAGKFGFIDLESSNFNYGNSKIENWEFCYINIAIDLNNQGFDVFISSHKSVRDTLRNGGIPFTVIFPSLDLKDAWINKLGDRLTETQSIKDNAALMRCVSHFEQDIEDLMQEKNKIIINDINYSLIQEIRGKVE